MDLVLGSIANHTVTLPAVKPHRNLTLWPASERVCAGGADAGNHRSGKDTLLNKTTVPNSQTQSLWRKKTFISRLAKTLVLWCTAHPRSAVWVCVWGGGCKAGNCWLLWPCRSCVSEDHRSNGCLPKCLYTQGNAFSSSAFIVCFIISKISTFWLYDNSKQCSEHLCIYVHRHLHVCNALNVGWPLLFICFEKEVV